MAKVLIDVSAYSKNWMISALREMRSSKAVHFMYSDHEKYRQEVVKVPSLARFLVEMRDKKRRVDADPVAVGSFIDLLELDEKWLANNKVCDDPHIFALMTILNGDYVFTDDKRLCECRSRMTTTSNSMCKFKAIRNGEVYKKAKRKIFKT